MELISIIVQCYEYMENQFGEIPKALLGISQQIADSDKQSGGKEQATKFETIGQQDENPPRQFQTIV